ncbi:glycerate kinase [Viridibacillus arvi]|uniref:Glycerate kinase n=1 Tax=Viridibacillus arvi TaxID=263475 RepID=A0A0M0LAI7_9BACL|nr:glycerate kinase [Viridibacillus arvi]KOO47892.1 glycerate kinase [Viridibacillus arvi]
MKIVVSPDSFKGSLTATEAAKAMVAAIHEINPEIETVLLPVADGGEGTLEPLLEVTNGQIISVKVQDPIGRLVEADYGILGNGETCVIEMAKASGLTLLTNDERNPLIASTYGTGQLIRHALDAGFRKFIIGIGGSATNDGGTGMLNALGMRFLNIDGKELELGAEALSTLHQIDDSFFDERIKVSEFIIACDVDNPFVGTNGATTIFGPQKGVTPEMVQRIDDNLTILANKIEAITGVALHQEPGAGAAGGLGGAFLAFFPVVLKPGIEVVMKAIDFHGQILGASLIITGEGKSDFQTLSGKAPIGVANAAKELQIPVALISGYVDDDSHVSLSEHFSAIASVVNESITQQESIQNAAFHLKKRAYETLQQIIKKL